MNASDEVRHLLKNRANLSDESLSRISNLVLIVPALQNLKDNAETSLKIFDALPEDLAEEIAPRLLTQEKEFDNLLNEFKPIIPDPSPLFVRTVESSSGSVTPYIVNATNVLMEYENSSDFQPEWVLYLSNIVDENSIKTQQKIYLPNRLEKINRGLGKMYEVAIDSYIKCKNRLITVDQSAIQLRDVYQQLWGGLVNMVRNININPNINTNRLEMKKQTDRDIVSELLSNNIFPKSRLDELLTDLYLNHSKLSDTSFGKNPLNKDIDKLNDYYNQWIAILDGISGLVS